MCSTVHGCLINSNQAKESRSKTATGSGDVQTDTTIIKSKVEDAGAGMTLYNSGTSASYLLSAAKALVVPFPFQAHISMYSTVTSLWCTSENQIMVEIPNDTPFFKIWVLASTSKH